MKRVWVTILFLVLATRSMATPEVYSCSRGFSNKLSKAHEVVKSHIEEMEQNAESIYLNLVESYGAPVNSKSYQTFSNMLTCIKDKIIEGAYAYRCAEGGMCNDKKAYVRRSDKALNHFLELGSIKFCEQEFSHYSEPRELEAIIVHEVSHLCLANDKQYFDGLDHPAMRKSFWLKNADTYDNIYYYKERLY